MNQPIDRADEPWTTLSREEALANAPEAATQAGLFKVPRVFGMNARRSHGYGARRAHCRGRADSERSVPAALDRIAQVDAALHAFHTVCGRSARSTARGCSIDAKASGTVLGPLHGVPIALKDNMSTRGLRDDRVVADSRTASCRRTARRSSRSSSRPAPSIIGKTNLDEFAMGSSTENSAFGPSRNPWATDRARRADRAADRRSRSRRAWCLRRSGPIPADRFVSPRRSPASSGSSRPTAACRDMGCWRLLRHSIRSAPRRARWRMRR